ncbi:MAG: biopolymer transport protein ExbB [Thermoproteota archaeon]|jgi:biopolymer transport protein ExbB
MRIFDYVQQGGSIMYILLFLNIIGMTTLLWRCVIILGFKKTISETEGEIKAKLTMDQIIKHPEMGVSFIKDEVEERVHNLEFGLNTVKIIASIAPLLGLLGTVVGILSAFSSIAEKGMSDPTLFAGGISMALVTTVAGLIVAIPHFIGYNYLVGLLDDIEMKLEKSIIRDIYKKVL